MENIYLLMRKSGGVPEASWLVIVFPKNWRSHSSGNFSTGQGDIMVLAEVPPHPNGKVGFQVKVTFYICGNFHCPDDLANHQKLKIIQK